MAVVPPAGQNSRCKAAAGQHCYEHSDCVHSKMGNWQLKCCWAWVAWRWMENDATCSKRAWAEKHWKTDMTWLTLVHGDPWNTLWNRTCCESFDVFRHIFCLHCLCMRFINYTSWLCFRIAFAEWFFWASHDLTCLFFSKEHWYIPVWSFLRRTSTFPVSKCLQTLQFLSVHIWFSLEDFFRICNPKVPEACQRMTTVVTPVFAFACAVWSSLRMTIESQSSVHGFCKVFAWTHQLEASNCWILRSDIFFWRAYNLYNKYLCLGNASQPDSSIQSTNITNCNMAYCVELVEQILKILPQMKMKS